MAVQQVSGSGHVQFVGLLKYSGQSDNTATQRIYNKIIVYKNDTLRYMQTACNHMQVVARWDRSLGETGALWYLLRYATEGLQVANGRT